MSTTRGMTAYDEVKVRHFDRSSHRTATTSQIGLNAR